MKEVDFDGGNLSKSVDFRFLDSASSSQIEAVCLYEYMRESRMLRDTLKREDEWRMIGTPYGLRSRFFLSFTVEQFFCLMLALKRAGFPKPWKKLSTKSRKALVSLLSCLDPSGDNESYTPVMIERGLIEFAPCVETADRRHHWRLESKGSSLLKSCERNGRKYFYGIIRIDQGCNETEAVEGFRDEFR